DSDELLAALSEAGIPSGTVRTLPEVYEWDQALSQGLKVSVDHPVLGDIDLPGPPLRFFDASGDGEVETTRSRHEAPPLLAELAAAADKSGVDEAVITGEGTISGRRVAVVVGEFRFLAGSIGVAAAERLVDAIERATLEGLPLLAGPASGGTRMQEGTIAFLS